MDLSVRRVLPEILDALDAEDPRARRARRDLQRVHHAMRSAAILNQAVRRLKLAQSPRHLLELGGGDGTLMLRFARRQSWPDVTLTILDQHDLVSPNTRAAFHSLGWTLKVMTKDAADWAGEADATHHDLCLANLFLHHFSQPALTRLLCAIARHCDAFVACEPRRNPLSLFGSRVIGLLGTSDITRQDAVTSVVAGFAGRELSAVWPTDSRDWFSQEYAAFPFTHCFVAARHGVRCSPRAP
jgi:Methyltransferase domain